MKQSRHAISMLIEKYRAVIQKMWWKNLGVDAPQRCRRGVCAAALFVSLAVSPGLAAAEIITFDGSDLSLLKPEPIGGMADSLFPAAVTGNTVTITGSTVPGYVYGGVANSANTSVTNNSVNITSGGTVTGHVYGGLSWQGSVGSNSVNITGGIVHSNVYGGFSNNSTATGNTVTISNGTVNSSVEGGHSYYDATDNSVNISGGTVGSDVTGGYSHGAAAATNTVRITGGTMNNMVYGGRAYDANASGNTVNIGGGIVKNNVYGGWGYTDATNNTVNMSSGEVRVDVYGGRAHTGNASGNSVNMSNGSVWIDVYGGYSFNGNATNNTVTISGGSVDGDVYGGAGDTVTGNTVNISGGTFDGSNRAVYAGSGTTVTGNIINISGSPNLTNVTLYGTNQLNPAIWPTAGNILNVKSSGMTAKAVASFQYYNFYLPTTLANGDTMLSVTNAANLTGTTIGVGINGATTALHQGDRVTLINAPAGLTAPGLNNTIAVVPVSIARTDTFTLTTDTENLYATATKLQAADASQAKPLLEGRMASITQIGQGADLLASQGMANARSATGGSSAPVGFFAMSGSHNRYETGSHVDVNGFSLIAGISREKAVANGNVLNGLFLEYGRGNYSTYNSFVNMALARGDGDTHYFGGGYLVRSQKSSGQYLEGSFRAGRASTDFRSAPINGTNVDYDISAPYYGMHLAFGKEKEVGQNLTLDTYVKGIWTHQNASSATVTAEPISFDAVNSHRWQLGMKLMHKVNGRTTVRTGLAYQHEFDGKAGGTAAGMSIESPSLKGGSGIVELGVTVGQKNNKNLFFDLSLQGFVGKCKGIAGNVEATWKF